MNHIEKKRRISSAAPPPEPPWGDFSPQSNHPSYRKNQTYVRKPTGVTSLSGCCPNPQEQPPRWVRVATSLSGFPSGFAAQPDPRNPPSLVFFADSDRTHVLRSNSVKKRAHTNCGAGAKFISTHDSYDCAVRHHHFQKLGTGSRLLHQRFLPAVCRLCGRFVPIIM